MALVGKRPGELAQIFGLSPGQISRILGSPLFLAELERLEGLAEYEAVDARSELELRQGLALEAIDKALLSDDVKLGASVGFEILDRTGVGKIQEPVASKNLHLHLHKSVDEMTDEELATEAQKLLQES